MLRPDVTPSIARAVAKYFTEEDMPVRLCYMANTFINSSELQGRLKETTQLGAELIGDGSAETDAELLALVVESLLKAGLKEFQVSVGHVDFFQSLLKEAGLPEEMELELREFISNKNIFGVKELLDPLELPDPLKEARQVFRTCLDPWMFWIGQKAVRYLRMPRLRLPGSGRSTV